MSIYLGNTEIGQIYLGSTEISEAYLGSTKVFETGGGGGGGDLSDYVQDGLVVHLDAIDRGTTETNKWIDLIGNKTFALTDCVIGTNYVQFNGSTSVGTYSTNVNHFDGTIEVVVDGTGWAYVEYGANGLMANKTATQFVFRQHSSKGRVAVAGGICNSANASYAVIDGINQTANIKSADYPGNNTQVTSVGKRFRATPAYFTGKIHAVRVYSRALSVAEMLQNQKVDNIRFNLGLNIT